ncbi:MAG: hypothetical protein J0G30_10455 [Actinomycetales bacterium]|nr:hypothetical protein [Actinomycetales bacterium]
MLPGAETGVRCSAAGCRADADWRVNWRNPRLHDADRVKVWMACDAHRTTLGDYLATRGFPVLVSGRDEPVERVPG